MGSDRPPRPLLPRTVFPRAPSFLPDDPGAKTSTIREQPGGSLIRLARERVAITQTELARRMGVPKGSVSRWERGVTEPSHQTVLRALGSCEIDLVSQFVFRPQAPAARRHEADTRAAKHTVLGADPDDPNDRRVRYRRNWRLWEREYRRELARDGDSRPGPDR